MKTPTQASIADMLDALRNSRLLRALLVGFLVLLLQIPVFMIMDLIGERSDRRDEAVQEVTAKWGKEQRIAGPALVVPYTFRSTEEDASGNKKILTSIRSASFLPDDLQIEGKIESELRHRGIFEIPVYRLTLDVKGRFLQPDFAEWGIAASDVLWDQADLWVRVSDARTIQNQATLAWNESEIPFGPGPGDYGGTGAGIHASLDGHLAGSNYDFSFPLELHGSLGVFLAPMGRETNVNLASNWPSPSFQGNWLPTEFEVRADGFAANWAVASLGRNYPQKWTSQSDFTKEMEQSIFGVDLFVPVDVYRMSERSVKYASLFLLLTFLSLWMFEVLAQQPIHSLQYLLVGAAMCIFYLLILSISEHVGFVGAYVLASLAVVGLITTYCAAVLKGTSRALVIGAIVAALYAYLYILLNNEDYALLIGSVGLFAILALVMYLTRKTDWHASARRGVTA